MGSSAEGCRRVSAWVGLGGDEVVSLVMTRSDGHW
jgi:hypothetical protein